jgi:hypothetical protein
MTGMVISEDLKNKLLSFTKKNRKSDLVGVYLYFIEQKYNINPVLFPKEKTIYQSLDNLIDILENQNKLFRQTEIKIQFGQQNINAQTKRIYICPFSGKAFGDNTHPNPQDAIYDWVSKCPENTEMVGGLKAKRFYISEDPEVIKNYIKKRKEPITKVVYSSAVTGKLFNSKAAVIDDFKKNHIKYLTLFEVQNQNRFNIEENFLEFLQKQLTEDKISIFVESLSGFKEFIPYLEKWLDSEKE